ncbi:non-ribosomal peptide synthetase [Streptomyces hebeiensis]|uniref:Non-ribosomal peptide synthetase n=1 Tax=Streptomyces hebeiensis TaxID=229486 RepID=A0ABN1UZL0_9ACTN
MDKRGPSGTRRAATGRRLHHVFEAACDRTPDATALECGQRTLTYAELDARANQLAHHLRALGIGPGSRVGILLPRSVETYVSLLAVGKAGAAFVPVDPAAPPDRVSYVLQDAGADAVLTLSGLARGAPGRFPGRTELDTHARDIAVRPVTRPEPGSAAPGHLDDDPVAYVIHTSGSSGRPKGVEIAQSSICNFLDVIPGVYDVRPEDRVYQGMTISFDFSIEEIWPTWAVGATVVAGPSDVGLLGADLGDFLAARDITVLYCVPTLLETIPRELPRLRSLVVGGEACPAQLVARWSRPGRRMLNTYGPTETTVTATWSELLPGRPVTIGRPLPTYTVELLDASLRPVPDGAVGEICVGGPGVARGYVGLPALTAERFVEHPLAPGNGRLYRTGDLGRRRTDGEIEFLGRADDEVKVRGYRVDPGEIDSVLLEDPAVAEAVTVLARRPGADGETGELAAYVTRAPGSAEDETTLLARLYERLGRRLPAYMVPSFLDVLDALPAMPSGKVDRGRLPPPAGRRSPTGRRGTVAPPEDDHEARVRDVWAEVLGIEPASVSVEADFFTELGGHSLLAARAVSVLRARGIGPGVALRDLYARPTVRGLAGLVRAPAATNRPAPPPRAAPLGHTARRVAAAGAAQAAVLYGLLLVLTLPVSVVYGRHAGRISVGSAAQATAGVLAGYLAVRWLLPALLVRPLTAGVAPGRHRLWGRTYLRLWTANLLLLLSPLPMLSGSPLMAGYLRLLGARIGPRTLIATRRISLPCMLRVGGGASIGYDVSLRAWEVADGWVTLAPIDIGAHAYVGANAVLEPGARVEVGAALGEQSVLGQGETVPAGARWAGSPPGPVDALGPAVESMLRSHRSIGPWRGRHRAAALLGLVCLEGAPFAMLLPGVALFWWASLTWEVWGGIAATALAGPVFVVAACAVVAAGKRLVLWRAPTGIHPARSSLGVRKWLVDKLLETSLLYTNSLYATLYTVPWLRLLGARIGRGAEVSTAAHLDPDLLTLGEGSFVADLASVGTATFAAGQVAFGPTEVGRRAFVGNAAFVPAGTSMGPGSLVGVATLPPGSGVPEDTTWLGSPALRLPVRQSSGSYPEHLTFRPTRAAVLQRLGIEFFRVTMPASALATSAWLYLLGLSALAGSLAPPAVALLSPVLTAGAALAVIAYCVVLKRVVIGTYRPRVEPLWSLFVRRTEFITGLYEAAAVPAGLFYLTGTPFLPVVLRAFGARIGRRVWIGTTYLTEFDLVTLGDDAAIGMDASLQTHLFEDRVMKMSAVTVRAGAGVGTRAVVLYDSVLESGARLGALSLLMKGEHLGPGTSWRGIPAESTADRAVEEPAALPTRRP